MNARIDNDTILLLRMQCGHRARNRDLTMNQLQGNEGLTVCIHQFLFIRWSQDERRCARAHALPMHSGQMHCARGTWTIAQCKRSQKHFPFGRRIRSQGDDLPACRTQITPPNHIYQRHHFRIILDVSLPAGKTGILDQLRIDGSVEIISHIPLGGK